MDLCLKVHIQIMSMQRATALEAVRGTMESVIQLVYAKQPSKVTRQVKRKKIIRLQHFIYLEVQGTVFFTLCSVVTLNLRTWTSNAELTIQNT